MIEYKNIGVWRRGTKVPWHPMLVIICLWVLKELGRLILTSTFRLKKIYPGDSGMHMTVPLRAVDFRVYIYNSSYEYIENLINSAWEYDPLRPDLKVCVIHDTGQGIHAHLQVHQNTRRRT